MTARFGVAVHDLDPPHRGVLAELHLLHDVADADAPHDLLQALLIRDAFLPTLSVAPFAPSALTSETFSSQPWRSTSSPVRRRPPSRPPPPPLAPRAWRPSRLSSQPPPPPAPSPCCASSGGSSCCSSSTMATVTPKQCRRRRRWGSRFERRSPSRYPISLDGSGRVSDVAGAREARTERSEARKPPSGARVHCENRG